MIWDKWGEHGLRFFHKMTYEPELFNPTNFKYWGHSFSVYVAHLTLVVDNFCNLVCGEHKGYMTLRFIDKLVQLLVLLGI